MPDEAADEVRRLEQRRADGAPQELEPLVDGGRRAGDEEHRAGDERSQRGEPRHHRREGRVRAPRSTRPTRSRRTTTSFPTRSANATRNGTR